TSNATGDCSIRRIIVPSEKPASTSSTTVSLVNEGVFSSLGGAPASEGGLSILTVALPVVTVSPEFSPLAPRCLNVPLDPPLFPKISMLLPLEFCGALCGLLIVLPVGPLPLLMKVSSDQASSSNSCPS